MWGLSVCFSLCLRGVSSTSPSPTAQMKMHVELTGNSESAVGVSVSADGCLSVLGAVIKW